MPNQNKLTQCVQSSKRMITWINERRQAQMREYLTQEQQDLKKRNLSIKFRTARWRLLISQHKSKSQNLNFSTNPTPSRKVPHWIPNLRYLRRQDTIFNEAWCSKSWLRPRGSSRTKNNFFFGKKAGLPNRSTHLFQQRSTKERGERSEEEQRGSGCFRWRSRKSGGLRVGIKARWARLLGRVRVVEGVVSIGRRK